MELTVRELAERLNCPYEGDGSVILKGVAGLERATQGDLVFLVHPKHREALEKSSASAAILPEGEHFAKIPVLHAENPRLAFARATEILCPAHLPAPGVHPSAIIAPSAKLGRSVSVGALCVVGEDVEIGDGAILFPLVTVYPRVKIGARTIIHSNTCLREGVQLGSGVLLHNGVVIGADGFAYIRGDDGAQIKIPQVGTVVIEDDVEIGANSTVDRAALGETVVRRGAKIDNLVMIAHNVTVGEDTAIAAQSGISGSTRIGKRVILAGQTGFVGHIEVGDDAFVGAKAGVSKDVPAGGKITGYPARDFMTMRRIEAAQAQLPELIKEVRTLKKRIAELEKK